MKYPIKGGLSPTHIKTYMTCPYQYYAKYITKEVEFKQNPAAEFGSAVHSNIENYLLGKVELTPRLEPLRVVLDKLKQHLVGAETKFCITQWGSKAKSFKDPDTHLKCIVDCVVASDDGKVVIAFDWKTGKKYDEQVQHDVIKKCLEVEYPQAEKIITVFWYFMVGIVDVQTHKVGTIIPSLDSKIAKVHQAHKTGEFIYNPNGLCKKWCDVITCPHNGRK